MGRVFVRKGLDVPEVHFNALLCDFNLLKNQTIFQGSVSRNRKIEGKRLLDIGFFRTQADLVPVDAVCHEEAEGRFEPNALRHEQ